MEMYQLKIDLKKIGIKGISLFSTWAPNGYITKLSFDSVNGRITIEELDWYGRKSYAVKTKYHDIYARNIEEANKIAKVFSK